MSTPSERCCGDGRHSGPGGPACNENFSNSGMSPLWLREIVQVVTTSAMRTSSKKIPSIYHAVLSRTMLPSQALSVL